MWTNDFFNLRLDTSFLHCILTCNISIKYQYQLDDILISRNWIVYRYCQYCIKISTKIHFKFLLRHLISLQAMSPIIFTDWLAVKVFLSYSMTTSNKPDWCLHYWIIWIELYVPYWCTLQVNVYVCSVIYQFTKYHYFFLRLSHLKMCVRCCLLSPRRCKEHCHYHIYVLSCSI